MLSIHKVRNYVNCLPVKKLRWEVEFSDDWVDDTAQVVHDMVLGPDECEECDEGEIDCECCDGTGECDNCD